MRCEGVFELRGFCALWVNAPFLLFRCVRPGIQKIILRRISGKRRGWVEQRPTAVNQEPRFR